MKTADEYIDEWNKKMTLHNLPASDSKHKEFDREAFIFGVLVNMVNFLHYISPEISKRSKKLNVAFKGDENVDFSCMRCGLKKKYWSSMFCGEGGEHSEK